MEGDAGGNDFVFDGRRQRRQQGRVGDEHPGRIGSKIGSRIRIKIKIRN